MENAALNTLFARAEIFNKLEKAKSQLNEEEAGYATVYMENLIKTRPVRPVRIPAAFYAPYGKKPSPACPESEQFEPGLHNLDFREPGLHAPELTDTNCEFCAAGSKRLQHEDGSFWHQLDTSEPQKGSWSFGPCEAQKLEVSVSSYSAGKGPGAF